MEKQITITIKNVASDVKAEVIVEAAKHLAIQAWGMNASKVTLDMQPDGKK